MDAFNDLLTFRRLSVYLFYDKYETVTMERMLFSYFHVAYTIFKVNAQTKSLIWCGDLHPSQYC